MPFSQTKILGLVLLLIGLALACLGLSWLLGTPQFQATARIKVELDVYDMPSGGTRSSYSYDPYFIQTTFEIIQSEVVLSNVVSALNLDTVWGNKFPGGRKLSSTETVDLLKQRMMLAPVRNTKIIAISVRSDNPVEAAKIANAIGNAYVEYRSESRKQVTEKGLMALEQQYDEQTFQIKVMQTNVDNLRKMLREADISSPKGLTNAASYQLYDDAKNKLADLMDQHRLFYAKMESDRIDSEIPKSSLVQIVDLAVPPTSPIGPTRFLGAMMLAVGLITALGGWFLLMSEREAAA